MRSWLTLTAMTFVTLLANCQRAVLADSKGESDMAGWHFIQKHVTFKMQEVYMARQAVCIDGHGFPVGVIACAPDWNAIVYHRGTKRYTVVPYSVWTTRGFPLHAIGCELAPVKPGSLSHSQLFDGWPAQSVEWVGIAPKLAMMKKQQLGDETCKYRAISLTSLPVPQQIGRLLCAFYDVQYFGGILVDFEIPGGLQILNSTDPGKMLIPARQFHLPDGYTHVQSSSEVFMSPKALDNIKQFGEFWGGS